MMHLTRILRLDDSLIDAIHRHRNTREMALTCLAVILAGTMLYGTGIGIWRSPLQAAYSAIKMPLLFIATVMASGTANAMLAQVSGSGLTFRQVLLCIAITMTISASLLGALAPVTFFMSTQLPASESAYPWMLASLTATVGLSGTLGVVRMHRLLSRLTPMPKRIMLAWFAVSGFAGCQLSWLFSPFLLAPGAETTFLNPQAFSGNFYEYLWHTLTGGI